MSRRTRLHPTQYPWRRRRRAVWCEPYHGVPHRRLADLAMQVLDLRLATPISRATLAGKGLDHLPDRLALPLGVQVRMNFVLGRKLSRRRLAGQDLERALYLEGFWKILSLRRALTSSLNRSDPT